MKVPFSDLKIENWQNLLLVAILLLYLSQFGFMVGRNEFPLSYGGDFLAFWSAGRIADEKGYAHIYDIESLKVVQSQELVSLGLLDEPDISNFLPAPSPYFSIFLLPFQPLSRISLEAGYWLWAILNLAILIGYLVFFIRRVNPTLQSLSRYKRLCFLLLLSFPVIDNLILGQLEVFLVICTGEFLRQGLKKNPLFAGLWLGGLLLKPQLLIVVIPTFIILRNWKIISGFFISSSVIVMSSFALSGFIGMQSLINIWTGFNDGNAIVAAQRMINWRMVAVDLNTIVNTSIGWVIAAPGMVLTIASIYFLIKKKPDLGTSHWGMVMLGLFSATLAITWHSHCHMAMIMIPSLIFGSLSNQLPQKVVFFWVVITPVIIFIWAFIALGVLLMTGININGYKLMVMGFSGFVSNLYLLVSTYRNLPKQNATAPLL